MQRQYTLEDDSTTVNNSYHTVRRLVDCNANRTDSDGYAVEQAAIEKMLAQQLQQYFQGLRTMFDVPMYYSGTSFQMQVWKQIATIPYGTCMSYKDVAVAIGTPHSYRAVGHAVGLNPLPIIVPCHRVIRSDGTMGEYALQTIGVAGRAIKKFLLNLELHNKHHVQ